MYTCTELTVLAVASNYHFKSPLSNFENVSVYVYVYTAEEKGLMIKRCAVKAGVSNNHLKLSFSNNLI